MESKRVYPEIDEQVAVWYGYRWQWAEVVKYTGTGVAVRLSSGTVVSVARDAIQPKDESEESND